MLLSVCTISLRAQIPTGSTDSWQTAQLKKQGAISVLWYDIEPFIYRRDGKIIGVEYEVMQGFIPFVKKRYGIDLSIEWIDAKAFEPIYPAIKSSKEKGLFAMSYYSITESRKKEVKFSPPYMPDLNIVVTSNDLPVYESEASFIKDLQQLSGFTMAKTTMEEDMQKLRDIYPQLNISNKEDDYDVLNQIAAFDKSFGYVPLSIYVVALQRGIKIKRQKILSTRREGFAAIYTKCSDWDEPINAYFNSAECKTLTQQLISKHLGQEVASIILDVSAPDSTRKQSADIELLTKEREIVTKRLIDTALQFQQSKIIRDIIVAAGIVLIVISGILYRMFSVKKNFAMLLTQRNEEIIRQKQEIEKINRQLKQKLVLSQLNPHLIFNSLTAIQYFVTLEDKKMANKYLSQLSKFIRQILKNAEQPLIHIDAEKAMLEQYFALEQIRFNNKFNYAIGSIGHEGFIPSMLTFPFAEDALYNRLLASNHENRLLQITFKHATTATTILIADNGTIERANENGVSMKLVLEQIEVLNANQKEKIIVEKNYSTGNNQVSITIPDSILL